MQKIHIKIGDDVKVISGSEKNKTGEVVKRRVWPALILRPFV